MTSILTNSAAIAALQTLHVVGSQLSQTQDRVSTGLRVRTASDNAAYWSIATTMRSDKKAISAVQDAIGLTQSIADTQYESLNTVSDLVSQVKAKLVAATDPSVSKHVVQSDIAQLQQTVKSVTDAATFSGVNWLATDVASLGTLSSFNLDYPSSFVRREDGTIDVGSMPVDMKTTSLINTDGGGALQKAASSFGDFGGLMNGSSADSPGPRVDFSFQGPVTFAPGDIASLDIALQGGNPDPVDDYHITINVTKADIDAALGSTDGTVSTSKDWAKVLQVAKGSISDTTLKFYGTDSQGNLGSVGVTSYNLPPGIEPSSVAKLEIQNVSTSVGGGNTNALFGNPTIPYPNTPVDYTFNFSGPVTFPEPNSYFAMMISTDGTKQLVGITGVMVDSALNTDDGKINTASDMAAVLTMALSPRNFDVVRNGNAITLKLNGGDLATNNYYEPWGPNSFIKISSEDGEANQDPGPDFDFMDINVTKDDRPLSDYIQGVEYMLKKTTAAGSFIGSVEARLQLQSNFAVSLSDSISAGVGKLTDADMEAESSKLAAQQVQQKLSMQALSIANSNPQNILSLFHQ